MSITNISIAEQIEAFAIQKGAEWFEQETYRLERQLEEVRRYQARYKDAKSTSERFDQLQWCVHAQQQSVTQAQDAMYVQKQLMEAYVQRVRLEDRSSTDSGKE